MAYNNRAKEKRTFRAGKWYHVDDIGLFLPGSIMTNMFRKPIEGEKTPDGVLSGDFSDWDMCVQSFSITIICDYNATESTDSKA